MTEANTTGVKRLFSDEYVRATNEMFDYLKMASKFSLDSERRKYWKNKAMEVKKYREELKSQGKHLYK